MLCFISVMASWSGVSDDIPRIIFKEFHKESLGSSSENIKELTIQDSIVC